MTVNILVYIHCYRLNVYVSDINSSVEILTSNVTVFGGRAFGR